MGSEAPVLAALVAPVTADASGSLLGALALLVLGLVLGLLRRGGSDQVGPTPDQVEAERRAFKERQAARRAEARRESERERAELLERRRADSLDDRVDGLLDRAGNRRGGDGPPGNGSS